MRIEGHIVDHHHREIFEGSIEVENGVIVSINKHSTAEQHYIMVGFVDAHVHIESSMLTPQNFGEMVIQRGTVSTVSDPHEIANVIGQQGVEFMLSNAKLSPIKNYFTIPSCVPATPFDVSGALITSEQVEEMAATGAFVALSEMMNVPGVLARDKEVMAKLNIAKKYHLPIDGHSPQLFGANLKKYIGSGICTEHEATALQEGLEKIQNGMYILLREGSAARNYNALHPLIASYPERVMFCTDDAHPDDIINLGHIDNILRKALKDGYSIFDLLTIASANPINHYKLDVGQLRVGDKADFIVVDNLESLAVKQVYINGELKYNMHAKAYTPARVVNVNKFKHSPISADELQYAVSTEKIPYIHVIPNQIITKLGYHTPCVAHDNFESDLEADILKIVYINRYNNGEPQVAFCKGFGLKQGAVASSIGHDSHNIVAVGCTDQEIADVVNELIAMKGGLAVHDGAKVHAFALPIAGIMSHEKGHVVAQHYHDLQLTIKNLGGTLESPFMTLSFLSLVVIPEVRIGEYGLFSYSKFGWL